MSTDPSPPDEAAARAWRTFRITSAAVFLVLLDMFWGPMAIAIMGGLIVGTVLTLGFVPALYVAWFRVRAAATGTALGPASAAPAWAT